MAVLNLKGVALIGFSEGRFVILDSLYDESNDTIEMRKYNARFEVLQDKCSGKKMLTVVGNYYGVSIPIYYPKT